MEKTLYLKRKQENLKKAMESGMLNPEQQYGLIESTIDDLLGVDAINDEAVKVYDDKLKTMVTQLEEMQKQISEHYKTVYEKILAL